jgi:hypothetical protein
MILQEALCCVNENCNEYRLVMSQLDVSKHREHRLIPQTQFLTLIRTVNENMIAKYSIIS